MLIKAIKFLDFDLDSVLGFIESKKQTQIVGFKTVFGKTHAIHSVNQTLKAFRNHENISKHEELEFLVRLSGKSQIKDSLKTCEPKQKSVFVSWNKNSGKAYADFKKRFNFREIALQKVSEKELKQALERSAMVGIRI